MHHNDIQSNELNANESQEKKSTYKKFHLNFLNNATFVPNEITFNFDLSDSEKLFLIALHSLPETWIIYQTSLAKMLNCSCDKIYRMTKSLIKLGYLRRNLKRLPNGKYEASEYEFFWKPIFKENPNITAETLSQIVENSKNVSRPHFCGVAKSDVVRENEKNSKNVSRPHFCGRNKVYNISKEIPPPTSSKQSASKVPKKGSVGGSSSKEEKQKQHEPLKVHDCLRGREIAPEDQVKISKYPESIVEKAVRHVTRKGFEIKKDLTSAIIHFCKNPSQIVPTKEEIALKKKKELDDLEDIIRERRASAERLAVFIRKNATSEQARKHFRVDNSYLEIGNSWRNCERIFYDNPRFDELLEHSLKKFDFPNPNQKAKK